MPSSLKIQLQALCACLLIAVPAAFGEVGNNAVLLNPNLATAEELAAVAGLSSEMADRIVEERPFLGIAELNALLSTALDEETLTGIYGALFIPLDLNNADRDSILLVPGLGDRMAHEFEEYRPYEAMARFRREMGKYVDDDEVARLEQYVFVPMGLNSATAEDFMTIPGVGKRMTHEFLEYRPYDSLEQFRREIGKYVDEDEVARLERYITLD